MQSLKLLTLAGTIALLVACGHSPQQKKDLAEAELTEEKTRTIKQYKECIKKARGDTAKLDVCERLLKVVDPGAASAQ